MQLEALWRATRAGLFVAIPVLLALLAGCPAPPPDNGPGNTNNNGEPTPGEPVAIEVVGAGTVEQEPDGTLVTLTAVPDAGWEFGGWTGADVPDENPLTVDVGEVPSITVTFVLISGPDCDADEDCDDGVFCNGAETCDEGTCVTGDAPCVAGETCDEENAACLPDRDGDGVPDDLDNCPDDANPSQADTDEDGVADACDNCPGTSNPEQTDTDEDGVGDECQGDQDGDGVPDEEDNCPEEHNIDQMDTDDDGLGDACDPCPNDPEDDADRDGVCGDVDQCPDTPLRTEVDANGCPIDEPPPPPTCGNGTIDAGEDCDDGGESATCDVNCTPAECGDGTRNATAGEECDDGNTTAGDGCDEDCQAEAGPANDTCANPTPIGDGETSFSNEGATTDGPDEGAICSFSGYSHIESDIWYCHEATCDDELIVSLCGSEHNDTKMAVYLGCQCPTAAPIACSDDDCGVGFESRITLQAQAGQSYLIRIGGFEGEQGSGIINILCGVETCEPGAGDCFTAHEGRGCGDPECCQTTCEVDRFCCDVEWDDFCAGEAVGLCTGSFPACAADAGSCASANGTPGCDRVDCCNTVCMTDPFCCVDTWDDICADEAFVPCRLACGGQSGSCFTANSSPGCSDVDCCEAVCDQDELCCEFRWDDECAALAATECR